MGDGRGKRDVVRVTRVGNGYCRVENRTGWFRIEIEASPPLLARMGAERVRYFVADIIPGAVDLLELTEAGW